MNVDYTKPVVVMNGQTPTYSGMASIADVYRMEDLPNEQVVRFLVQGVAQSFNAWTGQAYVDAGQWTDVQISGRAKEILEALPPVIV